MATQPTSNDDAKKVRKFMSFRKTKSESQVKPNSSSDKGPETANSNSNSSSSNNNANPSGVGRTASLLVKKNKSLKRIRGFLTGESRRERRARKVAAAAAVAANTTANSNSVDGAGNNNNINRDRELPSKVSSPPTEDDDEDDEESIYQVDVDERSLAASSFTPPLTPERSLLGYSNDEEVDDHDPVIPAAIIPTTSTVSSTMTMAPATTMEETPGPPLQVVLLLMDPVTRRFELLQLEFDSHKAVVNDVLAQAPHSVTESVLRKQTYVGICDRDGTELINTVRLAEFCKANEVVVAIPKGITGLECARLARPILSDGKVIAMLKSSGIDVSGWKEVKDEAPKKAKKSKKTSGKTTKLTPAPEPEVVAPPAVVPEITPVAPQPHAVQKKTSSFRGFFLSVAFIGLMAFGLQVVHTYVSSPIPVGQVVRPGVWLSRCGLLAFKEDCKNSFLHMGRDGVLTLYGAEQELVWQMIGVTCPVGDAGCVDGVVMRDNGIVTIGGKVVTTVSVHGGITKPQLSPWPFAEPPKVRVVRVRK